jgi:hypothetical protein
MVFANDSTRLLNSMDRFLAISSKCGIKVGFVFFDDCWNHQGASLDTPCVPEKGKHNGCWMASPQDIERTDVDRFKAYVSTTVQHFRADSRVLWWEEIPRAYACPHLRTHACTQSNPRSHEQWCPQVFNEPRAPNFTLALRDAGFKWAKAAIPTQPVLSCWDDNDDTELVDTHHYSTAFSHEWSPAVYSNPTKGNRKPVAVRTFHSHPALIVTVLAQSRRRCGSGEPSPGADVAAVVLRCLDHRGRFAMVPASVLE